MLDSTIKQLFTSNLCVDSINYAISNSSSYYFETPWIQDPTNNIGARFAFEFDTLTSFKIVRANTYTWGLDYFKINKIIATL